MTFFRIHVPLVGFRPYLARDYQETLSLPPPSTVFGCLLSTIGIDRDAVDAFRGTQLGLASTTGDRSTVLRKMRRDPANPPKGKPKTPAFRPEYQELLSDVTIWAWVERGKAKRDLAAELSASLKSPGNIRRHGCVSLGESCFLVDSINEHEEVADEEMTVLRPAENGSLSLTIWVDHADHSNTISARFDPILGRLTPADAISLGS